MNLNEYRRAARVLAVNDDGVLMCVVMQFSVAGHDQLPFWQAGVPSTPSGQPACPPVEIPERLVAAGGGYHRIVNRGNGMVADRWGNTANGTNTMQTAWNGGNNQQWRLNSLGNGRYQIVNGGTGTALDGSGNSTVSSTVTLWAPNSSTNNLWAIATV